MEKRETKKVVQRDPTKKAAPIKSQGTTNVANPAGNEIDDSGMLQDLLHAFNVAIASVDRSADEAEDKKKKPPPEEGICHLHSRNSFDIVM